jgi:nucleotide-binding universal stress UspA family protein
MDKILLVINAHQPDVYSTDFACSIASLVKTGLTGLFIENPYSREPVYTGVDSGRYFTAAVKKADTLVVTDTEQSVRLFEEQCLRKGVKPDVYIQRGEPITEIIFESRFADLLIIDPEISFYNSEEPLPSHFVKEVLSRAECPVLLAPKYYEDIDEIVFCYDGSASSVFAIKQLTYLFPELSNKKVLLLEVKKGHQEEIAEQHKRMMEWLRQHYHSVYYHSIEGDVKDQLFDFFFLKEKMLIVIGAYGRSILSNFFHKSNADVLIRMIDLPIFITHH